jgi:hypothetical protein
VYVQFETTTDLPLSWLAVVTRGPGGDVLTVRACFRADVGAPERDRVLLALCAPAA